ncbi:MAG: DNA mismatch repair endonuclease MutL [Candidatus Brocadiaceae bacterium]|nr:DNA mismatch repair endonuclease MutL [Candidatus Brocadiaceae bacterium]
MSQIKLLPASVINKIAAGELIDRPAAVVKELVENAIDAKTSRVDIYLEDGGKRLIRVTDDGIGMDLDDLAIAFLSHATSKLHDVDDLFAIQTLGFRGEALPSIGAVSHAGIISRRNGSLSGAEIRIDGGTLGNIKECGAPEGTQVEVKELFFNTPVRKKFMKSVSTEMAYISDIVTKFSLCYPALHFNLIHNTRTVFNLPPVQDVAERIVAFYGDEMRKHLIPVFLRDENITIEGYIMPPFYDKSNARMQFTFLNGRFIKDSAIFRATTDAYHGKLTHRRYPVVFLFLKIEPSEVDVNVHPTKIEVRFRNTSAIYNYVLTALKEGLSKSTTKPISVESFVPKNEEDAKRKSGSEYIQKSLWEPYSICRQEASKDRGIAWTKRDAGEEEKRYILEEMGEKRKKYFQMHNAFIVEELEHGFNIIDQHALHEIILYHEIERNMHTSKTLRQRLLIPELIELSPKDYFNVLSLREYLGVLGIEIEEFGKHTLTIRSFPQILKHVDGKGFIENLLAELHDEDYQKDKDRIYHKLINVMACRGAVKAGQRLEYREVEELLEKKKNINADTRNCPHGRPTTLYFSLDDLLRQFKRK